VTQDLEKFGYKQELKRALTLKDLIIYGLIFMVPIAPWGIYGVVADISNGMVPLAYLIGMVAMIFTALSYSRGRSLSHCRFGLFLCAAGD